MANANYMDYASTYSVYDETLQSYIDVFSLSYPPDFYPYKNYYKKYIIKPEEQYRPDKIAFNLLGDAKLAWVLDCINFFTHGIQEYYSRREIDYVDREVLRVMGII